MGCGCSCSNDDKGAVYAPAVQDSLATEERPSTPEKEPVPRRPARPPTVSVYRRTPRLPDGEYRFLLHWLDPGRQDVFEGSNDEPEIGPPPPLVPSAAEIAEQQVAQAAADADRHKRHDAELKRVRDLTAAAQTEATIELRCAARLAAAEEQAKVDAAIEAETHAAVEAAEAAEQEEIQAERAREQAVREVIRAFATINLSSPLVGELVEERLLRSGLLRWLIDSLCEGEDWRSVAQVREPPHWSGNSKYRHSDVTLPEGVRPRHESRKTGLQHRLQEMEAEEDRDRQRKREHLRREGREDREAEAREDEARKVHQQDRAAAREQEQGQRLAFACWSLGLLAHWAAQLQRHASDPRLHEGLLREGAAGALAGCLNRWEHLPPGRLSWAAIEHAGWACGQLAIASIHAQSALISGGAVPPLLSAVHESLAQLEMLAQPPTKAARSAPLPKAVHHGVEAWHRKLPRKFYGTGSSPSAVSSDGRAVSPSDVVFSRRNVSKPVTFAGFANAREARLRARLHRLGWSICVLCRPVERMERACLGGTAAVTLLRLVTLDHVVLPPAEVMEEVRELAPQAAPSELSSAVCFTLAELAHSDDSTHARRQLCVDDGLFPQAQNGMGKGTHQNAGFPVPLALGGGAPVIASVAAGAPEESASRVMRRLYKLLLLSLHTERQDEEDLDEGLAPWSQGEGQDEKDALGYAAARAVGNLLQGGGVEAGELLAGGVVALCRRASPPPPQKPDEEDEDGGRWEMESRKLCVRALSNLAATAATEAHEKLRDWENLLEQGTGKTHKGGVMDVLIPPAAADHYMDELEAKRRRKARSDGVARGLKAMKQSRTLVSMLGASTRKPRTEEEQARLRREEIAERRRREEAEARNVVALIRALGREATKKAAAAGTGVDENWGDLGSDAAEPGTPGSGVDWELVEESVWLCWNMVAAATVMQHVDPDSIEATDDVAQCSFDLPMARMLRRVNEETARAQAELRRRLVNGLLTLDQHDQAVGRLERWTEARRRSARENGRLEMLRYAAWRNRLIDGGIAEFLTRVLRLCVGPHYAQLGHLKEEIRWRLSKIERIESAPNNSEYKDKKGGLKRKGRKAIEDLRKELPSLEAEMAAVSEKAEAAMVLAEGRAAQKHSNGEEKRVVRRVRERVLPLALRTLETLLHAATLDQNAAEHRKEVAHKGKRKWARMKGRQNNWSNMAKVLHTEGMDAKEVPEWTCPICTKTGIKVSRLSCTQCGTPNPDPPPPPEPEPVPEPSPKRKMWNRKGEEIEPPPLKLNEKEKTLLKKFLQIKLNNAWQGWKGWWVDNKRYPGLRVMRRSDFCDVLLCLRDGGPGGDTPGGRLAGAEHRLDRLAHLPRAEGGGEIGRLAASLCAMWPDPDRLAKEKEEAPLPAGWTRRESLKRAPGERYFVNTKTNYVTWTRPLLAESRPNSRSSRPPSRTSPSRPVSRGSMHSSSPSRPSSRAGKAEGAVWADFRFSDQLEEVIGEKPYPLTWPRVTGAPGDPDPRMPDLPRGSFARPLSPSRLVQPLAHDGAANNDSRPGTSGSWHGDQPLQYTPRHSTPEIVAGGRPGSRAGSRPSMTMTPPGSSGHGRRPGSSSSAQSPSTLHPAQQILGSAFENLLIPPEEMQPRPRSSNSAGGHRPGSRAAAGRPGSRQLSVGGPGPKVETEAFPVREGDELEEDDEDGDEDEEVADYKDSAA